MTDLKEQRERVPERRRHPLLCFTNAWDPAFFTHHDLAGKDDVSAVEARKSIGDVADKLTIFLQIFEEQVCPCDADEVKRYCKDVSLEDVEAGIGEAGERRNAWLDDRNSPDLKAGSGKVRLCNNPFTATGLLRYLKQPVWARPELPPYLTSPIANAASAIQ
jgi:hypothetical protein